MDDEWEHISEKSGGQDTCQLVEMKKEIQMLKTVVNSILETQKYERQQRNFILARKVEQEDCLCTLL